MRSAPLPFATRAGVTTFVTGWPSIIAVILNTRSARSAGHVLDSHFGWQIRTFWSRCVAGGGRDGVRQRLSALRSAGDLDADGLVGALPHRARWMALRRRSRCAAGAHRLEPRRVRAARVIFGCSGRAANAAFGGA